MSKDDSGSAFPHHPNHHESGHGMTLRDWFAGQALQGFLANPNATQDWIAKFAASSAYAMADAMLVERNKP